MEPRRAARESPRGAHGPRGGALRGRRGDGGGAPDGRAAPPGAARPAHRAGEPTSPLCRVAAAADFGNGISWVLSRLEGYTFINPDLTIYLHRMPAGEWVCLEAATWPSPDGIGFCESRLWDERGLIGRALQSLLLGHQ